MVYCDRVVHFNMDDLNFKISEYIVLNRLLLKLKSYPSIVEMDSQIGEHNSRYNGEGAL